MKPKWLQRRRAAVLLARADRERSTSNLQALDDFNAGGAAQGAALRSGSDVYRKAAGLRGSPTANLTRRSGRKPENARRKLALAASLVAGLVGASAIYAALEVTNRAVDAMLLTTDIGEIREVPLKDGSKVILDTASSVSVEMTEGRRLARLERGRARFSIVRQDVPFTIRTPGATVSLEQGVVDLASDPEASVQLISGTAKVGRQAKAAASAVTVRAPAAVSLTGGALHQVARDPDPAWPTGRLTFSGTRLADVIAAANRYSPQKIELTGAGIADLRVTGVFRAGDPEGLAGSLAHVLGLRLERRAGRLILAPKTVEKKTGG